jgi:ABC-type uncharacterized transport system substrate-binding protein
MGEGIVRSLSRLDEYVKFTYLKNELRSKGEYRIGISNKQEGADIEEVISGIDECLKDTGEKYQVIIDENSKGKNKIGYTDFVITFSGDFGE